MRDDDQEQGRYDNVPIEWVYKMAVQCAASGGYDQSALELLVRVESLASEGERVYQSAIFWPNNNPYDTPDRDTPDYDRWLKHAAAVVCFREPFDSEESLRAWLDERRIPSALERTANAHRIKTERVEIMLYGAAPFHVASIRDVTSTQPAAPAMRVIAAYSPPATGDADGDDDVPF